MMVDVFFRCLAWIIFGPVVLAISLLQLIGMFLVDVSGFLLHLIAVFLFGFGILMFFMPGPSWSPWLLIGMAFFAFLVPVALGGLVIGLEHAKGWMRGFISSF